MTQRITTRHGGPSVNRRRAGVDIVNPAQHLVLLEKVGHRSKISFNYLLLLRGLQRPFLQG